MIAVVEAMSSNLPAQSKPTDVAAAAAPALPAPAIDLSPLTAAMPAADDEGKVDVRRLFAAIMRYKWLVLIMMVVGTAGGYENVTVGITPRSSSAHP